jgi:hypothetical protein
MNRLLAPFLVLSLTALGAAAPGEKLEDYYGGKLDRVEGAPAIDWTVTPDDVWRLSSFEYKLPRKLELSFGPSTVVIAKHEDAKGKKSAVWAALFPDDPTEIVTSEPGHSDSAKAVFLRFHPSVVGDLFPSKTVEGPGEARWLVWAKQQFGAKINGALQRDNMPVVPEKPWMVFDIDAVEGDRHFYFVDTKKKTVKYEPAFTRRGVPKIRTGQPLGAEGIDTFRAAWAAFDKDYAMFGVKEDVNWKKLYDQYEPLAAAATSEYELAGVIGLLVSHLKDLHVWVKQGERWVPTYNRYRVMNGNWQAVKNSVEDLEERPKIAYGRVGKNKGYMVIWGLEGDRLSDDFDEALEALGDTSGLIVDLRFNGGGNETIAQRIAGRFLKNKAVYSKNQYRDGKLHKNLSKELERACLARGPWRYAAPVVVLQGEKTMSSAESFVLMLAQAPNVTTMGDRTAGSSANPKQVKVGDSIMINVPRWLDMTPDGKPIDAVGIQPDEFIDARSPVDFAKEDPVFEAALDFLKKTRRTKPGREKN